MKLTKEAKEKLRFIATKLPTVFDYSVERSFFTEEEAKEEFPDTEIEKDSLIKEGALAGKVVGQSPVMMAANHYRRLKKAFQSGGEKAVKEYIKNVQSLPKG